MDVRPLPLTGLVPRVRPTDLDADLADAGDEIRTQLTEWGFMAVELPGIGARVHAMTRAFAAACGSVRPSLADHTADTVPQAFVGGTHGFFPYNSEVPRLANGVPDPKEFIHISGAMLADQPAGAAAVLRDFPQLATHAAAVFETAYRVISLFGAAIRGLLPPATPPLTLARPATNLRIIRYRDTDGRAVLAHEHSGIQLLGLQLPPTDQGLQYVLHDGEWVEPVIAGTDVLLCNIGRMLATASGGRLRPSTHRVHRAAAPGYQRLSSVLFAYPPLADRQWRLTEAGDLHVLEPTWGDFIADRFAGLGAS